MKAQSRYSLSRSKMIMCAGLLPKRKVAALPKPSHSHGDWASRLLKGRIADAPLLQRLMVAPQIGLQDALRRALSDVLPRLVLCHRGSLDSLAYWLAYTMVPIRRVARDARFRQSVDRNYGR